jgi:uncharacterized protein
MIRLNVVSVGLVEDTASVIVVLRADDLARLLVMEVGLLEGRAIAMEAEGVKAPRPLTHDLMYQIIQGLGASLAAVQIRDFQEHTFFANLVLTRQDGTQVELDARPSDAIALALRSGAPIYVAEPVLETAGITEDEAEAEEDLDMELEEAEDALEEDGDDDEEPIVH